MKKVIILFIAIILIACSRDSDTSGTVYSGRANLNTRLHQFTATNEDSKKEVILTMTGPHELTFSLNDKLSHLDYEEDLIIVRADADSSKWSAKKIKDGFELQDGTLLEYGDCPGWSICVQYTDTKQSILKGRYSLRGNSVQITLWISGGESHVELLGLVANALFNKSRNEKLSIDAALETLSSQVWTY